MASDKVIVIGGGLAGLSAAHTVLERGGRVLLLDKHDYMVVVSSSVMKRRHDVIPRDYIPD
jgi:succinate dehydrogenase/fumarate reductase flavoprotein subunit